MNRKGLGDFCQVRPSNDPDNEVGFEQRSLVSLKGDKYDQCNITQRGKRIDNN